MSAVHRVNKSMCMYRVCAVCAIDSKVEVLWYTLDNLSIIVARIDRVTTNTTSVLFVMIAAKSITGVDGVQYYRMLHLSEKGGIADRWVCLLCGNR